MGSVGRLEELNDVIEPPRKRNPLVLVGEIPFKFNQVYAQAVKTLSFNIMARGGEWRPPYLICVTSVQVLWRLQGYWSPVLWRFGRFDIVLEPW
jgi:hypothetical protein